jgi:hypothetical protein
MLKKTYTSLPSDYSVCEHSDCPQARTCLHQLAYAELMETEELLRLINPGRCTKNALCPYYRSNAPVLYARGFTNFQARMYPAQFQKFKAIVMGRFGRNPYYERRRGEVPLSPAEQAFVLGALRQAGITEEFTFDRYEEMISWYD